MVLTNPFLSLPKRKIFVSYHHGNDAQYYQGFAQYYSTTYDVLQDVSVDRVIDSDNADYVIRTIRENYITGSSCTVVLCGAQTRWRKFVDWEIKATLDRAHGLIGVNLPTNPRDVAGRVHKPDRLQDNIDSGYAIWIDWNSLQTGSVDLTAWIEAANSRSKTLIVNSRSLRRRNG